MDEKENNKQAKLPGRAWANVSEALSVNAYGLMPVP
jgi:hypothetical protein